MRDDLSALFVPDGERDPLKAARREMKRPLPKRFYAEASVEPVEDGFGVALDGKIVHTPARKKLAVPARSLAESLAAEWRGQGEHVDPGTMPKTRLVNSALDGVAREMDAVAAEIAKFAGSDLICYRAAAPERLVEAQNAAWNPVLDGFRERLGVRFMCAEGVVFVTQPEESVAAVREAVTAFGEGNGGAIKLAALNVMTTLTGSALIALALAQRDLSFDAAWDAAHVDEDFQMRLWGADDEALARRAARKADMRAAYEVFSALGGEG
jgi:chaperone required for assembly of F1-ATPase